MKLRFLALPFALGAVLLVGACSEPEEAEIETEPGIEEPAEELEEDEEVEVEVDDD